jgi:hypothetical protein
MLLYSKYRSVQKFQGGYKLFKAPQEELVSNTFASSSAPSPTPMPVAAEASTDRPDPEAWKKADHSIIIPLTKTSTNARKAAVPTYFSEPPEINPLTPEGFISPTALAAQIYAESGFNPDSVSTAQARGIAQITEIGQREAIQQGWAKPNFDPLKDKVTSIKVHNAWMDSAYKNKVKKGYDPMAAYVYALVHYNYGSGNLNKSEKIAKSLGYNTKTDYTWVYDPAVDMPTETKDYIAKILYPTKSGLKGMRNFNPVDHKRQYLWFLHTK